MSQTPSQDAAHLPPGRTDATVQVEYLDARRRKRELLAEVDGGRATPEDALARWPANPDADADVASLLFEDFRRRRCGGEQPSLADYEDRFPAHRDSLADLVRRQDFFRSVGGVSASAGCGASWAAGRSPESISPSNPTWRGGRWC